MLIDPGHQGRDDQAYEPPPVLPACPECQYDLRATATLAGARCPECGAKLPFDRLKFPRAGPQERRYRRQKPLRYWVPVIWTPMEAIAVGLCIGTTIYLLNKIFPSPQSRVPGLIVIVVGIALGHALIVVRRRCQVHNFDRKRRMELRARGGRRPDHWHT